MRDRAGRAVSVVASLLFLVVLVWPYAVRPAAYITTYYRWGVLNPLFAGVLVVAIPIVFGAVREDHVSSALGAGIALALGLFSFLITTAWAFTVRLDVFQASGWALPAQRFVLVGLSLVVVLGAAWHVRANGLLSVRR